MPSQTIVSLSLGGITKDRVDPNNPDTIVISINHQGDVLVGNAALASTSYDTIIAAVKSRIDSKELEELKFVLYADSGADGSLVPKVLNSLTQLGVKSVSLIDY
jgi:biopolymer transport protein ExbD